MYSYFFLLKQIGKVDIKVPFCQKYKEFLMTLAFIKQQIEFFTLTH